VQGISVRDATLADVPAVVALVESAYRGDASRAGWTTEADLLVGRRTDEEEVTRLLTTPGNVILVATHDVHDVRDTHETHDTQETHDEHGPATDTGGAGGAGAPVGCCHLQRRPDGTAYFGLFAVRPAAQGGGIGGVLLAAAEQRARRDWAAKKMEMTVIGQREDLIAWYRRKGYQPNGHSFPWPPSENVRSTPLRDDLYFAAFEKPL